MEQSVSHYTSIVTLSKSETYKETIKEKSTILPYSIHKRIHVRMVTYTWNTRTSTLGYTGVHAIFS